MLTDTHAHLDMEAFDKDRDDVLQRARQAGVTRIITIGIDMESSLKAVEIAEKTPGVYASVGFHPHDAEKFGEENLERLLDLAQRPKVVAWGEIGLDFFRNYSPAEAQHTAFERQLAAATRAGLPVIIHDRDAHPETLKHLQQAGSGPRRGVIHCFSGDPAFARSCMKLGYYISIPGTVTFKNALQIQEVVRQVPLERLLVETDAPFLAPVPYRGKRNEPAYVRYTAAEAARLKKIPLEVFAEQTTRNACHLFGIPEPS